MFTTFLSSEKFFCSLSSQFLFLDFDVVKGVCVNLFAGSAVATVIYTISYNEKRENMINDYLKNIIHIINYGKINNNEIERIKILSMVDHPFRMVYLQEFICSVSIIGNLTKFITERVFSFAENKDNFFTVFSSKKSSHLYSVFKEIDNTMLSFPNSFFIQYQLQKIKSKESLKK